MCCFLPHKSCGDPGHFARNCPSSSSGGGCFNCGEEGQVPLNPYIHEPKRITERSTLTSECNRHNKAECPNPRKGMGACFNCGEEGHSKVDCPNPRKTMGACFNCGEEGHSKADCTKPRVFKGICRICSQEGHPASACPERPPDICKNCHIARDCKANRKFDLNHVADRLPDEAWAMMKAASEEKDLVEFRTSLQVYSKAVPDATYADIEKKMRKDKFKIFLIGLEKEPEDIMSLIDLQGRLDQMGHSARGCKQEKTETEKIEIKCTNCGGLGHRVRDCKEQRRSKYGCRNCGSEDHDAKECPKPRDAANVECRRCNETGHFAKDCPQASERPDRGPRTCRNCGSEDHIARDCDMPRDPSTMTCRNCDQSKHRIIPKTKGLLDMVHEIVLCRRTGPGSNATDVERVRYWYIGADIEDELIILQWVTLFADAPSPRKMKSKVPRSTTAIVTEDDPWESAQSMPAKEPSMVEEKGDEYGAGGEDDIAYTLKVQSLRDRLANVDW
ncbi:hypothetical protein N7462_007832 [Penicillium macrosclerotiorum]|uniref:uncharacterized protein n=1 Tax=Penicillium macrosclerotiorum TaxID=303699 RepID=UPI002548D791|nr:uncharacterized protein N7462_007832 [Penicillium macrosclerotiorum]KAJ5679588.1 hypothetical protein N7462_007832 [Penicillium macrosclerotiorum]